MNDYLIKAVDRTVELYFNNYPVPAAIQQAKKEMQKGKKKDEREKDFKRVIEEIICR